MPEPGIRGLEKGLDRFGRAFPIGELESGKVES
jgi:hypothetical protein